MKLNRKTILITGGSAGLGNALANVLWLKDNRVIVCGRNKKKMQKLPQGIVGIQGDLSDQKGLKKLLKSLKKLNVEVDVLINNAASITPWDQASDELLERELYLNLTAPMLLTRWFLAQCCQKQEKAIVNISSKSSITPFHDFVSYSVSKRGLSYFTEILREQLKYSKTKVFHVIPPALITQLYQAFHTYRNTDCQNGTAWNVDDFAAVLTKAIEAGELESNFAEQHPPLVVKNYAYED